MIILPPYKRSTLLANLEYGLSGQVSAKLFTRVLQNVKVKTVGSAYLVPKSDATL
jgi:hypothetical protein